MSWGHRTALTKTVAFGILLKPCQLIIELKHTSTLETSPSRDTAKFKRNNPIIPLFCVFVPGISCRRLNRRELAYEIQRLFGSTHETCRNANVALGSLAWNPSRLKEQFLDCDGRAIYWQAEIFDRKESNSKVLFLSSTSRCRKRTSRKYKKSNKFILVHHRNIYKSNFHNRSTFHPLRHVKIPLPQEVFPPQILRPRPWPSLASASTAALASMSPSRTATWPSAAAKCSGVTPREAAARGPSPRPRGEKLWEIFGTSKVKVLEIVAPALGQPVLCGKMRRTSTQEFCINKLGSKNSRNPPVLGTPKQIKAIPSTCFFASGISCDRPNMAKLANEIKKLRFESRDINVLKLSHEGSSEWRL